MRSTRTIQLQQLRERIDKASQLAIIDCPPSGWLHAVRQALGMSGAALGRRLGKGRTMVGNLEGYEREGRVTLNILRQASEAMGCRFVYAIVPPPGKTMDLLLEEQAAKRAAQLIRRAAMHMMLEGQQLGASDSRAELARVSRDLLQTLPRDFWDIDEPNTGRDE